MIRPRPESSGARCTFHASRFTLLTAAALCLAWMNPTRDRTDEGNRLFKQGKYDAAIAKYGEVLVDNPDSALLNFNMGDANYKAGKFSEALASFVRVRSSDDPKQVAKVNYNAGNAQYRLAAAAEASKPEDALKAYASALVLYRRALGADPTDHDAKFNYEFVTKKIDDLKKKLEEQKKQQEQKKQEQQQHDQPQQQDQQQAQQDQQQQQSQQDQQQQEQQLDKPQDQGEPQQADQNKSEEQKQQEAQAGQPPDEQQQAQEQQAQAAGDATTGGEKKDKMSPQEAAALIDTAKNDELQPDEFARRVQGGRVAEPAQDW
jgi:Ca-activated chloride channel family protein